MIITIILKIHIINSISFSVAPDPVENCTVINKSSETFHRQCTPGFDGGMAQSFVIAVTDRENGVVVYNATRQTQSEMNSVHSSSLHPKSSPLQDVFIQNLSAGHSYIATVTPINEKGRAKYTSNIDYKLTGRFVIRGDTCVGG